MPGQSVVALLAAAVFLGGCTQVEQPTPATSTPPVPATPTTAAPPTQRPTAEPTAPPTAAGTASAGVPTPTAAPTPGGGRWPPPPIAFETIAEGFENLTYLTHAGDGSGLLYIVEQRGVINVAGPDGAVQPEPFLDIADRISAGGERGLLGLAFHPGYADNGRFFVSYTDRDGNTVIAEFAGGTTPGDPADPASERVLLQVQQPFGNHNGGMIDFGPDGMLYVATGDGGSAGDPQGNGQDLTALLGKLLRVDVDGQEPYAIPPDNPFVDAADARLEIWNYGLRNPWRFSFDRQTGALFIGDVGQNRWEEVDVDPAGQGGRNYGWNVMEGPDCFAEPNCDPSGLTLPVAWYETSRGCAVTGGYVYRGAALPGLVGAYLYADYCSGDVWALEAAAALAVSESPVEVVEMGNAGINVTSFGEDEAGELYLVGAGGQVLRVVAGK